MRSMIFSLLMASSYLSAAPLSINEAEFAQISDSKERAIMNAITQVGVREATLDREVVNDVDDVYRCVVKNHCSVPNQKSSGRCWMFAGLNVARMKMIEAHDLPESFELSQTYLYFHDKMERLNYYLNATIETLDRDFDDRLVKELNSAPLNDGGQWDMLSNLIAKYGMIPKSKMGEFFHSEESRFMNRFLTREARSYAAELRAMRGASEEELRIKQREFVADFRGKLVKFCGEPPKTFDWNTRDKEKNVLHEDDITPLAFYEKYVKSVFDPEQYICLIHDPRSDHPYNKLYTVEYLGNVQEGHSIRYLNLPIEELKAYTLLSLRDHDEPVWFGMDVGKNSSSNIGIIHPNLYAEADAFGKVSQMDKATRLLMGESAMTHAMVIDGVDLRGSEEEPEVVKWRVLNSWGEERCAKGYFHLVDRGRNGEDGWEYVYEVLIPKKLLKPEHLSTLNEEPTVLPLWDPMGALAL